MHTPCETGLFVGVDEYDFLPDEKWLHCSSADIARVCGYFQAAAPNGRWTPLAENDAQILRRANFIEAFSDWIDNVQEDECGLFYFSGHAEVVFDSLVLAASDYRLSIPYDSGVPLSRLLQLARRRPASRFLFLLDCCRESQDAILGDNIPPNTTIIYACLHGGKAYEGPSGGLLARALLDSLVQVSAVHDGSAYLPTLFPQMQNQLTRYGIRTNFEKLGGDASKIYLPLKGGGSAKKRPRAPDCWLKTNELSEAERRLRLARLKKIVEAFRGDPQLATKSFEFEGNRLVILVPKDAAVWSSRPMIDHMIQTDESIVEGLIRWKRRISTSIFESVARQEGLRVSFPMGSDRLIHMEWDEDGERLGQIHVDLRNLNAPTVSVISPSKHGLWPLKYLKRMSSIFDMLRAI